MVKVNTKPIFETIQNILNFYANYGIDKSKIIMGFEPDDDDIDQQWEGIEVDKQAIDYIAGSQFGGVMFWAINETDNTKLHKTCGEVSMELA